MDDAGTTTGSCRQHKSCTLPSHGLSAITCSLQLTTFCLHRVVHWICHGDNKSMAMHTTPLLHYSTTPDDSTTLQVNNCRASQSRRHWIGAVPVLLTNPTCQPMDHQHWCFAHPMGHSMGPGLLCCYVHLFSASLLAQHHPMGHSMDPQSLPWSWCSELWGWVAARPSSAAKLAQLPCPMLVGRSQIAS